MRPDYRFVVVDVDAGVPLAERQAYAAAQQRQLREHFAPSWDGLGENDAVRAATPSEPARPDEIQVLLLAGQPDQSGAIAYHDALADGTPIIKVWVHYARLCGDAWTSCASHEVLETRGDPRLRACVELDDGTIWDREVCDRVESDVYKVDGVELSSFNTPECFEPPRDRRGVRFDYLDLSSRPNEVRPGGYAQRYDRKGWTQVGEMRAYRRALARAKVSRGARRAARRTSLWQRFVAWLCS